MSNKKYKTIVVINKSRFRLCDISEFGKVTILGGLYPTTYQVNIEDIENVFVENW